MGSPDKQPGPSSRPALERRTTETAASSGDPSAAALETTSSAPTSDGLRRRSAATDGNSSRSKGKEREFVPRTGDTTDAVEVLIHQLLSTDTLPRIALQYGIDLAVLRKTNKLWTSDSLHVRRTLYIPLSACHLREELIRGPAEDEVTLLQPESTSRPNPVTTAVNAAQRTPPTSDSGAATTSSLAFEDESSNTIDGQDNPWLLDGSNVPDDANQFLDSFAIPKPPLPISSAATTSPSPSPRTPPPPPSRASRVIKVALIDRKELSFFPRSAPSSGRASLDSSLMQLKRSTPATIGRRRPSSTTTHSPSLSRKISNLFLDVPASLGLPGTSSPTSPALSTGAAFFGNGRPSLSGRQRSVSDYGRGPNTSSRTSLDLLGSPPAAEHVELSALTPTTTSPGRKADWFSSVGRAPQSNGVIRQQVAPMQPMMVIRDPRQDTVSRKVGDGLGDGRIKDVWIG